MQILKQLCYNSLEDATAQACALGYTARQFSVVRGLEHVLVAVDPFVADELVNEGRTVLKCCWHFSLFDP